MKISNPIVKPAIFISQFMTAESEVDFLVPTNCWGMITYSAMVAYATDIGGDVNVYVALNDVQLSQYAVEVETPETIQLTYNVPLKPGDVIKGVFIGGNAEGFLTVSGWLSGPGGFDGPAGIAVI